MHENHDLMTLHHKIRYFLKSNEVEIFARLCAVGFPSNSQEMLLERYRPEGRIKVKESLVS
jgi:hypothetical protein